MFFAAPHAALAQIDTLVQPRGTPIPGLPGRPSITTGIDANAWVGTPPPTEPFDNTQPAGVVRTTEPVEYYVRLYAPPNSNAVGTWLMRASTVRGLTPAELRDRFALPFLPTHITNVLVSSGTCLLSGIAGPIMGNFPANPPAIPSPGPWGQGGAQQTKVVGVDTSSNCSTWAFMPASAFINQRAIGANALWYAPVVGPGNAGNVGAYLDRLPAPAEYSDLYDVYNKLDTLNDGTPTALRPALQEIGGENHATEMALALNNADRGARLLSGHARESLGDGGHAMQPSMVTMYAPAPQFDAAPRAPARWWASGLGQFGRVGGNEERSGYRFDTGRGIVGYERQVSPDWLFGAVAAIEGTGFSVDGPGNSNTITTLRAGGYAATEFARYRLGASLLLSWDHVDTSRSLPTFNRSASASYDGGSVALAVEASRAIRFGGTVVEPLVGLSLVDVWRPGFSESGAGALSLQATSENAVKLASRLGATLSRPMVLDNGMLLRPWLRAFWAHDFLDRDGRLTASLAGATGPGTFTVLSTTSGRDVALVGAGLKLDVSARATVTLAYDGEWGRHTDIHTISAGATMRW